MRRTTILTLTTCLAANAGWADVTPEDVLDVNRELLARMGLSFVVETDRTGDTLAVTGGELIATFPIVGGGIQIDVPPHEYIDRGDGSVAVIWPNDMTLGMQVDIPDSTDNFAADLRLTTEGASTIVTGTPEEMTFSTRSEGGLMTATPRDLSEDINFSLDATYGAYDSETVVRSGTLMTVTNVLTQEPISLVYSLEQGADFITTSETSYGAANSQVLIALPENIDILNLGAALRAGLSVAGTQEYAYNRSEAVTVLGGSQQRQVTDAGETRAEISLDSSGFYLAAVGQDFAFTFGDDVLLPFDITGAASEADIVYRLPILGADTPEDFRFRIALSGLTTTEDTWQLFDPEGTFPRDPIDVTFDVGGTVLLGFDLTDIGYWSSLSPVDTPDVTLESLDITDVSVAGFGASAQAEGSFTVDNTDMTTFDGLPRPEGQITLVTQGVQALLDRLEESGLVGPSEIGGARMGLGMFARSTGEDSTETVIEVNPEAHVIVNGQRMR